MLHKGDSGFFKQMGQYQIKQYPPSHCFLSSWYISGTNETERIKKKEYAQPSLKGWASFFGDDRSFKGTKGTERREQNKTEQKIKITRKTPSPRFVDLNLLLFYKQSEIWEWRLREKHCKPKIRSHNGRHHKYGWSDSYTNPTFWKPPHSL